METLTLYLLKVNVALALFYLMHAVLLKKETFLNVRRYFFLSILVFSIIYPLFTINSLAALTDIFPSFSQTNGVVAVGEPIAMEIVDGEVQQAVPFVTWQTLAKWLLLSGTVFFALRFVWQLLSIYRIKLRSQKRNVWGISVYNLQGMMTPFSFFRWIFMNVDAHSETEMRQILAHEQTHVRQWHSVDVLFAELACIFFWWNPFVWLMKKEIAINLEYLADNGVLRRGIDSRDYQYHLLRLTYHETAVQIVNNFNVSQLKQRIMMMNTNKSPARKLAKYLTVLPLAFLLVTINSCTNKKTQDETPAQEEAVVKTDSVPVSAPEAVEEEAFVVVENQPEFPGGQAAMMKFLSDSVKYPVEAQEKGIEGRVIANFVVEKDGSLSDFQVVRGVDPLLDKEAIRVLKTMPNWKPGKQKGENVRVRFTLPVVFRLVGNDKKTSAPPPPPPPPATFAKTSSAAPPPPPPPPPPAYTQSIEELQNTNEVFVVVENQPEFPEGNAAMMKFLGDNVKYPTEAQEKGIQGRAIVNFVVEKDGRLSDVKIVRGVDPLLDAEAIRLIQSMPNWKPGTQKGQAVRVRYTLPVVFRLQQ